MLSGQLFGPGGNTTLEYWIDGRRIRAAWKAPQRKRPCRSVRCPRSVVLRLAELTCMTTSRGRKMNIDLDSWEAGYADGQYGRSPQCAIGLDQVSPEPRLKHAFFEKRACARPSPRRKRAPQRSRTFEVVADQRRRMSDACTGVQVP